MQSGSIDYTSAVKQLVRIDRLHRAAIEAQVKKLGLHRSQHIALMYIANHGSPTQTEIAKALEISPAAVTVSLKKLERAGFIVRKQNKADTRANNITLTEKAEDIVKKTGEMFSDIDAAMCRGLTEEELECFVGCIGKMTENLKEYASSGE